MTYKLYCDRCDKEIAGWDNEYGQVMSVTIGVKSSDRGNNDVIDGEWNFCSAKCALEYLKPYVETEEGWIDVWKRGKILGTAPVMPKKKSR